MMIGTLRRAECVANEPVEGSISTGTMLADDIAAAISEWADHHLAVKPRKMREALAFFETPVEERYDDEASPEYLNDLFDVMNELAPDGMFFGSHVGNGADFGFWTYDDDE